VRSFSKRGAPPVAVPFHILYGLQLTRSRYWFLLHAGASSPPSHVCDAVQPMSFQHGQGLALIRPLPRPQQSLLLCAPSSKNGPMIFRFHGEREFRLFRQLADVGHSSDESADGRARSRSTVAPPDRAQKKSRPRAF